MIRVMLISKLSPYWQTGHSSAMTFNSYKSTIWWRCSE